MFGCCCVNKKALKKEQQLKNEKIVATVQADDEKVSNDDAKSSNKSSPQKASATAYSPMSPVSEGKNDKSNSSEEGNNLSGLIMTDGLVDEINIQLKNRLEREKSIDTTSGGSNITVIEGHLPEGEESEVVVIDTFTNVVNVIDKKIVENESDRNCAKPPNESESSSTTTSHSNNSTSLHSCLLRRDSSRASIKKKVRCSETAEVIPPPDYFINIDELSIASAIEDDDEDDVFSDKIPAQIARGNMCTPYVQRKGSLPMLEALPDWFPNPSDSCGTPPTTPLTPFDELALKRHRLLANLIDTAIANNQIRFDQLETFDFSHSESATSTNTAKSATDSKELVNLIGRLERIVTRLEQNIPPEHHDIETSTVQTQVSSSYSQTDLTSSEDKYLPTVLPHIEKRLERIEQEQRRSREITVEEFKSKAMSVNAYEDIILGSLAQFLDLSNKIGDDVATQAEFVKKAFDAQLQYVTMASQSAAPDQSEISKLLQPTSDQIMAIQNFREKHRTSKYFNHLSAISESIPALGWVCISPTPGPHVKEMNDAGQFYTNRVLKEWKEKDITHVNWAKAWIQTLTELQQYIKQYHTTGIVWAGKAKATLNGTSGGSAPPPPPLNLPPPPPMPAFDPNTSAGGDDRSALFAQINQGADITKNLKKVTSDMQTHKNPNLRSGPAPFKPGPTPFKPAIAMKPVSAPVDKPPVFTRDGKKWLIEYHKNNPNLLVENAEMNNVVYMFKSENSTLTVKGKINSIVIDSCKKCCVVFDNLVSSVEFVNCQSVQMQVLGKVPTISIDKTDGCQMYLSKDSLDVEIISSKSSEMNVLLPTPAGDDYVEQAIPEQFKTVISGNTLQTSCNESLG
ncbi:hypothetical protein PVAND_012272 [Polypedilum vanderplanki]|uniref:Adenylyl cyclase-associated protein n=1 Tax=Polypedilum vanderplanki TaxID=319348 RepID=A0A9J6CMU9_POLVA|nr:hypothetical protein PVAND_012272 [Polypedilum vanderplanki]